MSLKTSFLTALLSAAVCGTAMVSCGTDAPAPYGVLPSPAQVEWQKMETNMFCHFALEWTADNGLR